MPRLNQPLSLKKICLKALVTHFELVCYGCCKGPARSQMIESELYLKIPGPFLQWPSILLEEILESVSEQRSVSRIVLHVVMQPHLQALNLSCGIGDVYYAIQFLEQRCQNIQRLDLSYISYLNPKILSQLLVQLTQLTNLNLRLTLTTDQVLADIGSHCSHLRELDVSVTPVTDRGLGEFTINCETGQPQGQELLRLVVTETRISPQGIARTLRFLPQLRQVECESLIQAFDYVTETPYVRPDSEKTSSSYQLISLKSTTELESGQTVSRATRLCPEVRNVSLVAGTMSADALQDLVCWKQLTELSLSNGPSMSLDFWDSILPILRQSGHQLRSLILTRFTCVDVLAIGHSCPTLKNLALSEISHYIPVEVLEPGLFYSLEALELWGTDSSPCSCQVLKQLLTWAVHIKNLLFRNWLTISDSFLCQLWQVNQMKCLSHLTFDSCHNISPSVLETLLGRENDLNLLRLWSCKQLQQDDYLKLQTLVKEGNMDIFLDWYPYEDTT